MEKRIIRKVREFYESNPYPCQLVRTRTDLERNEHSRVMSRILSTVGWKYGDLAGKRVLDAGCGTGEKALFCAMHGADADAFDISAASIGISRESAKRLNLEVNYSVDSFEKFSSIKKYDLILCIGSLHHTGDAQANFMRMAALLAPGGRIVLGLYNLYGRLFCRLRRRLLWLGENSWEGVLAKLGLEKIESAAMRASVADRYGSPHETYHSIGGVLGWFSLAGIAPISTFPNIKLDSRTEIPISQLRWLAAGRGFFFIGGVRRTIRSSVQ